MTGGALARPPSRVRRVAFLGTPSAAVPTLSALIDAGFEVPLVISQPDRRRGRGSRLTPSPVKSAALERGLDVSVDPYDLLGLDVDLGVVVAYGRLLRRDLLEKVAMVNVHFSLLPRWRGAAPVERAILAGDATTGVCVMGITEGLDEGPVYRCVETAIDDNESSAELTARLADLGARLLVDVLSGPLPDPEPQTGTITHAAKMNRSENELDFTLPAVEVHRRVRIGRAWSTFRSERLGIEVSRVLEPDDVGNEAMTNPDIGPGWIGLIPVDGDGRGRDADRAGDRTTAVVVATGGGLLQLVTVKPAGKRAMPAIDWWNGAQPHEGEHLGR